MNKKTQLSRASANDDIVSYVLIKKLLAPINTSKAYKLGLVDLYGRTIREPETQVEQTALTSLDRLVYKLRRILSGRINVLYQFIYTRSLSDTAYKNATFGITLQNRPEIKRVSKGIKSKLNEEKSSKALLDKMNIAIKRSAL